MSPAERTDTVPGEMMGTGEETGIMGRTRMVAPESTFVIMTMVDNTKLVYVGEVGRIFTFSSRFAKKLESKNTPKKVRVQPHNPRHRNPFSPRFRPS